MGKNLQPLPTISVIVPVYNLEAYLETCLDSIERQTYQDYEVVIVNDGSTDCSEAIALNRAEKDSRIVVVTKPNEGLAKARETGIQRARGAYITYLDADDTFEPRMLEELAIAAESNGGYDIVCCNFNRVCPTYNAPYREKRKADMTGLEFLQATLCHAIRVTTWSKLYKTELLRKDYDHHPLRLGQDNMLNIQIGCHRPRVRFIDYPGYNYVQRSSSANHKRFEFDYCKLFCETIDGDLHKRNDLIDGRAEFYSLLNKVRWYLVYVRKSHARWQGDTEFAQEIHGQVGKYRRELRRYFSRSQLLLLSMDRYKWMRPAVVLWSTLMRWGLSLKRRMSR